MPPQGTPSLSCQRKRKRTERRQPSGASGRARAGRCPRARTGRPRRGATAVRPSSEGGTAGANRLGRHGRRSPPRRRLRSERMERPRACPTHSSRAAAPPALVARADSLASMWQSGVVRTNSPGWREAHALCATCRAARAHELVRAWERGQQAGELGAHTRSIRRRWIVIAARQSTSANQD